MTINQEHAPAARIRAIGRTHVGLKRSTNEDAFVVADVVEGLVAQPERVAAFDDPRGVLLAVSDGMGGAAAGEIASALVIESLLKHMPRSLGEYLPHAALERAIDEANQTVRAAANEGGRAGMGATVTAVLVRPPVAFIAQIGDSRAYVFRRGELAQLTRDQTHVQFLLERGLDPESMGVRSNAILQAIGTSERIITVTSRLELRSKDVLLLCSDGLSSLVSDTAIASILDSSTSLRVRSERLVQAALDAGGRDNVTVVLASVEGDAFPSPLVDEPVRATFRSSYPERRAVPFPFDE